MIAAAFNFSHVINELSFGPFYPSLVNPLDSTVNGAEANFHKFQYFMSVVPTVYSVGRASASRSRAIFTNQYAVTEQSSRINEQTIPGIFFKYDIEPILLIVSEQKSSFMALVVRLVNVISGVLVGGGWMYQLSGWFGEILGRRRRGASAMNGNILHT